MNIDLDKLVKQYNKISNKSTHDLTYQELNTLLLLRNILESYIELQNLSKEFPNDYEDLQQIKHKTQMSLLDNTICLSGKTFKKARKY